MYVKVKISYGQKYGQSNSGSTVKDVKSDNSNTTQHQLSVAQFLTVFTKLDLISWFIMAKRFAPVKLWQ